jgi:hypothetical protein
MSGWRSIADRQRDGGKVDPTLEENKIRHWLWPKAPFVVRRDREDWRYKQRVQYFPAAQLRFGEVQTHRVRNMERVGELDHFVDRVWVRVIVKKMLMRKKKAMCKLANDIEVSELQYWGYNRDRLLEADEGYWREKMNMSSGDAFVNEVTSQWTQKDEKYLEFVGKITRENLMNFGKFVLNEIASNEEWDLVNLILMYYEVSVISLFDNPFFECLLTQHRSMTVECGR